MKLRIATWLLAVAGVFGAPAAQALPSYSGLVIFGDSLSDSGNNALNQRIDCWRPRCPNPWC